MTLPRALGNMNTTIERVFKRTPEGFFRESYLHFLNFLNEDGSLRSSRLEKEIVTGRMWKVARPGERSSYGEVDYMFPGEIKATRLICINR